MSSRFAAAAAAGLQAIESPSDHYDRTPEAVAALRQAAGVACALINTPRGDWAGGERGLAALPGRVRPKEEEEEDEEEEEEVVVEEEEELE